jgi:1-acyl-sn-glycerol-3-phosphate acyltransferase
MAPVGDWLSSAWYKQNFWACMAGMTLGFSLRTEGMCHVPAHGPALLIANHQSYLDPIVIALAARRRLRFLARKTLFQNRAFAWLLSSFGSVPIDQEGIGIEGLRVILRLLQENHAVAIFPEGERTYTGRLSPLRPGIHLLLKRCPAPVVAVGVAGAYAAWSRWRPLPLPAPLFLPPAPGNIAVSIRPPLEPRCLAALPRERLLTRLFDELQTAHDQADRLRRKT